MGRELADLPPEWVHETKSRSLWSGEITALCGAKAKAGTYQTDTWRLFGLSGPKCPACQKIKQSKGGAR